MRNSIRIGLFLAVVLAAVSAQATTLIRLSLEQLSQASSEVVRGRAVSQETRWNNSHTQIVTLTTVEVEQTLKGSPQATLVIEQPGGSLGNLRVRVPGTVGFRHGASYFLFLEPAPSGSYHVTGMAQGAYRIYRLPQSGEERVVRPFGALFKSPKAGRSNPRPQAQTISTQEFLGEIAAAMAAPLVIPGGTSIPVTLRATRDKSREEARVSARTTATVYPSPYAVVPAGSLMQGTARLTARRWKIHWSEISIRGKRFDISAGNDVPAGESLDGRMLVLNLR